MESTARAIRARHQKIRSRDIVRRLYFKMGHRHSVGSICGRATQSQESNAPGRYMIGNRSKFGKQRWYQTRGKPSMNATNIHSSSTNIKGMRQRPRHRLSTPRLRENKKNQRRSASETQVTMVQGIGVPKTCTRICWNQTKGHWAWHTTWRRWNVSITMSTGTLHPNVPNRNVTGNNELRTSKRCWQARCRPQYESQELFTSEDVRDKM